MKQINIRKDLRNWFADYITNSIHEMTTEESPEFNKWAKSFKRDEAEFLVNMEFGEIIAEWCVGGNESEYMPETVAKDFAEGLIEKIIQVWYF